MDHVLSAYLGINSSITHALGKSPFDLNLVGSQKLKPKFVGPLLKIEHIKKLSFIATPAYGKSILNVLYECVEAVYSW